MVHQQLAQVRLIKDDAVDTYDREQANANLMMHVFRLLCCVLTGEGVSRTVTLPIVLQP